MRFEFFWQWFEEHVKQNDVLRVDPFTEASRQRWEREQEELHAVEDQERQQRALLVAAEKRSNYEEQFEMYCADMYINDEITRIINKGAVLEGMVEHVGGPALQGEHISLICAMMELWGCSVAANARTDTWNVDTIAAWQSWLEQRGMDCDVPRVDSEGLRRLIDKDSFQDYLLDALPMMDSASDDEDQHVVEVRGLIETEIDALVEAIDEETGDVLQFAIPDALVDEVRVRLEGTDPVVARVDLGSGRVTSIFPVDDVIA